MKAVTFRGGVHPRYQKDRTAKLAVEKMPPPQELVIPMSQHIGAPAKPVVEAGDEVLVGQVIGEPLGFVSTYIHSSVSGKVKAVEPRLSMMGSPVMSVVIENDGEDRLAPMEGLGDSWPEATAEDLKDRIAKAGLVGMGGAAFPTHVKLSPPSDKKIDTVILNGAECEPYLTADHRIMVEQPEQVVTGLLIAMKVVAAKRGVIGIEENKQDALAAMQKAAQGKGIEVLPLEVKYPQGAEKQLIDATLKRQVPSGGLPMDVGVVVQNVGTAAAIADAVLKGKPLYERVMTLSGSAISQGANLLVRVGTPVSAIIERCGGIIGDLGKLISGGPMMGIAQSTDEVPVVKGTSGILAFSRGEVDDRDPGPCIRCGRCVRACPMRLAPTEISSFSVRGLYESAEKADAMDCIECGSCSFVCPSRIPLVQQIRLAKAAILAARRKQKK